METIFDVPAESRYLERDGLRLHHLDWGNHGSHPIVLVHGVRLHAHVWNHFGRRFSDRYHLVALDQRGHGDSAWASEDRYQLEDFYQDLAAVADARGLPRFTLVGHSLGGRVSMLYAHRHPERLERLVLVDITAGMPDVAPNTDLSRVTDTPPPEDFDTLEAAIEYLAGQLSLAPYDMVVESVRRGIRRGDDGRYTWKYDPGVMRRRRFGTPGMDAWKLAAEIATPTLLQYGSESRVVTPELAARMGRTMPRCTVERIERASHALFTDQPEAFAASVERFLRSPV